MMLTAEVQRAFDALSRLGRTGATPNAPARSDQVAAALAALDLHAPDELITLYSCADGTNAAPNATIGEISIMPGYYWPRFADAVETYKAISPSDQWNATWFPVLASGGGDFYAVICNPTSSDHGAVVGFLLGELDHIVEFESLTALFATISASYEAGAFSIADGHLVADYAQMRALSRQFQPEFSEHDA